LLVQNKNSKIKAWRFGREKDFRIFDSKNQSFVADLFGFLDGTMALVKIHKGNENETKLGFAQS
jgi:hypothetical protein